MARLCNHCSCGNATERCVIVVGLCVALNNINLLIDARNVLMANLYRLQQHNFSLRRPCGKVPDNFARFKKIGFSEQSLIQVPTMKFH